MENTGIIQLEKEVALRGRIIETIVSANEELREKCALLGSFIQSKASGYSTSEKEMLGKILGYSLTEKSSGTTERRYSVTENESGTTELGYSVSEKENGTTDFRYSIPENEKGTTEHRYSISENDKGTTGVGYSISEKEKGITNVRSPLPEKIDVARFPRGAFQEKFKEQTNYKGRRSAPRATTDLLVHIYNGGDCGYPALRKVTHLSTGGLGKMLMRLTKKGLIKRTGLQKLALTESSLNLLRQTWGNTQK